MSFINNALFTLNVGPNEFYNSYASVDNFIGACYKDTFGHTWRLCKFAGNVAKGKIVQMGAARALTTCAAGTAGWYDGNYYTANQIITDANISTAMTQGAYAGWWACVIGGTGVGQVERIRTNDATHLYLENAFGTALAVADSNVTLYPGNPYENVVIYDYDVTSASYASIIGSVQCDVVYTTYPYAWVLSHGLGIGITDSYNYGIGQPLMPSDAADGNMEALAAITETTVAYVRSGAMATASTNYCLVDYCIE